MYFSPEVLHSLFCKVNYLCPWLSLLANVAAVRFFRKIILNKLSVHEIQRARIRHTEGIIHLYNFLVGEL